MPNAEPVCVPPCISALKYATKHAMKQEKGSKAFDKMMAERIEC